jgi:hypothetical protein
MSHSYFPGDQPAADASLAELETEEFPIHSGDHHHHHHHEHHKHEHHRHEHEAPYIVNQGDSPYTVNQGDTVHHHQGFKTIGTVSFAVSQILAVIKPLNKRDRSLALGHAIARLIESDHLDGSGDILTHMIASTNRYHVDE